MHYVCPTKTILKPCFKLCFDCMERPAFSAFNYCIFTQGHFVL